jgi:hyperosmotically inducible protein
MKTNRYGVWGAASLLVLTFGSLTVMADSSSGDARIQAVAQDKLFHARVGDNVAVRVEEGVATLDGAVDSIGQKERAVKEVWKVEGVTQITDKLRVEAAGADDSVILKEASRRIRKYAFYSIFDNVDLSSKDGMVVLKGQVTQPWRRADIARIVEMVPGVRAMENSLEVLPVSPFDDEIRLRVARAIYREPGLSRYSIQAYPPIHIVVKNGNVRLTGVVNNAVEKALAERAARFAATYFGLENNLLVESEMNRARS